MENIKNIPIRKTGTSKELKVESYQWHFQNLYKYASLRCARCVVVENFD